MTRRKYLVDPVPKKHMMSSKMVMDLYHIFSRTSHVVYSCWYKKEFFTSWQSSQMNPKVITMQIHSGDYLGFDDDPQIAILPGTKTVADYVIYFKWDEMMYKVYFIDMNKRV